MPAYKISDITGVIPALVTPFTLDGALDLDRLRAITHFLIERGVSALYVTGSTGEGFLMSPQERKQVVETVIGVVAGRIPIIVHVGAISTWHSADLARHAEATGADAVSAVPPIYWNFPADQVFEYYADITAATDLPMIVYTVPLAGGMAFDMVARLATIRGVAGIKYTGATHFDIMRIKQEIGSEFIVYSGADEMAMSGLAFGADSLIGSFYNIMPETFFALYDAMKQGRLAEAEALQSTANAIIMQTLKHNPNSAMKRMMAWQGADAGYCRKPFGNFDTPEKEEALKNDFRRLRDERGIAGVKFLEMI